MSWIYLIVAGLMEVGFTFCLGKTKTAEGNALWWWWGGFIAALALSMYLMAKASRTIPLGTVYPVWPGIGAVGAVRVGILFFNEPTSFRRIFFITTLIISVIGLKLVTKMKFAMLLCFFVKNIHPESTLKQKSTDT